jgi:hypothetical protein
LTPVAGIITLGEGNPLSHVQLLARNFGIPNIAIAPGVLGAIEPLENRRVIAAVATDGSLVLSAFDAVPSELSDLLTPANLRGGELTVPPVDLAPRSPVASSGPRRPISVSWRGSFRVGSRPRSRSLSGYLPRMSMPRMTARGET